MSTTDNKPVIIIDSSAKEEFKKMMNWTEEDFKKYVKPYKGDPTKEDIV